MNSDLTKKIKKVVCPVCEIKIMVIPGVVCDNCLFIYGTVTEDEEPINFINDNSKRILCDINGVLKNNNDNRCYVNGVDCKAVLNYGKIYIIRNK